MARTIARKAVRKSTGKITPSMLRSQQWFNNPHNVEMNALYIERYMNWGLTREELQSGKPVIDLCLPVTAITSNWPIAHAKAFAKPVVSHLNFRFTRFRKPASVRARRSIATSRISAWLNCFTATSSMAWCLRPAATKPRPRS